MVFYGKESAPERYKAYLRERIEQNEAVVFLAYDENGKAIGFVLNYRSFSSVSLGKVIVLNDLYVSELARNRGIGRRLIERTFRFAEESGSVRVDLGTAKIKHCCARLV
jgi:GNAT superfamily N-acetyltransferase